MEIYNKIKMELKNHQAERIFKKEVKYLKMISHNEINKSLDGTSKENSKGKMETVRAVERALDILNAFKTDEGQLSLSEIVRRTGLSKTTAFRLITTLEQKGFLAKGGDVQEYMLGLSVIHLGSIALRQNDLMDISLPIMKEIWELTHETISLNIERDRYRICIKQIRSDQGISQQTRIGEPNPLWLGASGKILLAFMPESEKKKVFEIALKEDIESAQRWEEIEKDLLMIRKQGYVVSYGERLAGAGSVAAPIYNHNGIVIAGLTISGPIIRFTEEQIERFIKYVVKGAERISKNLGCPENIS